MTSDRVREQAPSPAGRTYAGASHSRQVTRNPGESTVRSRLVRGRDGSPATFDPSRISRDVLRALRDVGCRDHALANEATRRAIQDLAVLFDVRTPGVADIRDAIERALMSLGRADGARAYVTSQRRSTQRPKTESTRRS
jgi:hypothetical protein